MKNHRLTEDGQIELGGNPLTAFDVLQKLDMCNESEREMLINYKDWESQQIDLCVGNELNIDKYLSEKAKLA